MYPQQHNPFVLGDYPELTSLALSNNKSVDALDVTKCTKLEELFINGCNFELIDISQAPALRILNVADNKSTASTWATTPP